MARSSRILMQDNRARIVACAAALFRARGVDDVGIAEVMQAAGMTQGGFYRHFASKDALAAAACDAAYADAARAWRRVTKGLARERAADAIREHYLLPRPAERSCPILAFGPAAVRQPDSLLATAYRKGLSELGTLHAELTGMSGQASEASLAEMVGRRVIAPPAGMDRREMGG